MLYVSWAVCSIIDNKDYEVYLTSGMA